VQADAQDGGGTDNANFSTPPDGTPGRMQMYIFSGPSPRRDGDFDAEVVFHEHTHGLSWRLVGGGQALGDTQSDGMGEGWADFYGLALLSQASDDVNGNFAMGGYVTYQLGGMTQNYYYGIRRYPYTTDMTKNPLTFKDLDPVQASAHTGISRSPIIGNTANEVHNEGEVWCVTLNEARVNLINKYGWLIGNQLMLQLATDGMKLTVAHPNFLQARDGIILADQVDNAGANYTNLWAAFAKRGMGVSASSPASSTTTGIHESFDVPDPLHISPGDFSTVGNPGGPFSVTATNYVLTNTSPAALNWALGNVPSWLNVSATAGTIPAGGAATVNFRLNSTASNLVSGTYGSIVNFSNLTSGGQPTRQFTLNVNFGNDLCSGAIVVTGASYTAVESTVSATSTGDPTPTCTGLAAKGVWFSYTPASSGTMVVDTIGSSFDTVLATYTGACGALTQIGCNDDINNAGGNYQSSITNNLVAGVTYHILAGGYNSATGLLTFHLNFSGAGPTPPVIAGQPANQTVNVGSTATFSVTATGTAPISYQWTLAATNLPGATSPNLVLNNVQLNQAGTYAVIVTNAYGSAVSSNAILAVNVGGTCTPPPSGLVSWWPGEGNANDIIGNNNGILTNGAGFAAGEVGQGFTVNGAAQFVKIPRSASLNSFSNQLTIEFWMRANPTNAMNTYQGLVNSDFYLVEIANGQVPGPLGVSFGISTDGGASYPDTATVNGGGAVVTAGQWHHVAGTYDGAKLQLFIDGVPRGTPNFHSGAISPMLANSYLAIGSEDGRTICPSCVVSRYFNGQIDEVALYNRALSTNEIAAIYAAGSAGKCNAQVCDPPPSGLVSWWPGEGTASDIYGTNNGTLSPSGVTYVPGRVGQAFRFDGTNGYVQIPDAGSLKPVNVTLEAWVWLDPAVTPGHAEQIVFKKNTWNAFFEGYSLLVVPPGGGTGGTNSQYQFQFVVSHNGNQVITYSTTLLQRGLWYHVAATYDGGTQKLFVNGAPEASAFAGFALEYDSLPVFMGSTGIPGNYVNYLAGIIDEPSIYSRALAANEIAALYAAGGAGKCQAAVCTPPPSGLVSWWPGDGNASDIIGTNNGTLSATGASYVPGHVGQAFRFDGTNGYVSVPDSDSLKPANITLESWVWLDPAVHTNPTVEVIMFKKNTRFFNFEGFNLAKETVDYGGGHYTNRFDAVISSQGGNQVILRGTSAIQRGVWYHVAETYDGNLLTIYVNGVAEASVVAGFPLDYGTRPLFIGQSGEASPYDDYLGGIIDEPSLYSRALSSNEIAAIYLAGSAGKCSVVSPTNNGVAYLRSSSGQPGLNDNENVLTGVFGSGWQDLRYETADPNALFTSATRFIFMEGGQFATDAMGTFLTNNMAAISDWVAGGGRLLVNAAPIVDETIDVGFGVTLISGDFNDSVVAADAAHPIFNGPYLPVGTAFSGDLFNHAHVTGGGITPILVNVSDHHYALAEKTFESGRVMFGGMTLPYFHAPTTESSNLLANILAYISGQNTNQPPPPPTNDVIHFDDLPDNSFGYKLPSGYHGLVWSNFYELNGVAVTNGGFPHAVISPNNVAFNRQGGLATLGSSGFFNLYSGYFTAARNDNLVLTAVGRGLGGVLFSNDFVLSATDPTFLAFNYLGVTNVSFVAAGGTPHPGYPGVSNLFVLDDISVAILPGTPPFIETDPVDATVVVGDTATFSVGASGSTPLYYFWQVNGTLISGATGPTYSLTNVSFADSGNVFNCVVSNAIGTATSANAQLTVVNGTPPIIFGPPDNQWAAAGGPVVFSIFAFGSPTLAYQWQHAGTNLVGATNASYAFTVATNSSGTYSVIVTNAFGAADTSGFLTLLVNSSTNDFVLNGRYVSLPVSVNGQFISQALQQGGRFNSAGTGGTNGVDFWYAGSPLYNYVVAFNNTDYGNGSFLTLTVSNLSSPTVQHARITGLVDSGPVLFTRDVSFGVNERVVKVVDTVQNHSLADVSGVAILDNINPDQGFDGSPGQSFETYNDVASVASTNDDVVVATGVTNNLGLLLGSESGTVYPSATGFANLDAYSMLTVVDPDGAPGDIAINLARDYGTIPAGGSTNATWFMVFGTSYGDVTNAYRVALLPKLVLTPVSLQNCQFHFTLTGPAGTNYVLEAGSSLLNFVSILTNTLPSAGVQDFLYNNACFSNRFYRAKFAPASGNLAGTTATNGVIYLPPSQ
jgi:hypothetical protein